MSFNLLNVMQRIKNAHIAHIGGNKNLTRVYGVVVPLNKLVRIGALCTIYLKKGNF